MPLLCLLLTFFEGFLPKSDNVAEDMEMGLRGLDSCHQHPCSGLTYLERQELVRQNLLRSSQFQDISSDTDSQVRGVKHYASASSFKFQEARTILPQLVHFCDNTLWVFLQGFRNCRDELERVEQGTSFRSCFIGIIS